MTFLRINQTMLDTSKITALFQDEKGEVIVLLDSGERLRFDPPEGAALWRELDEDKGWRDEHN